MAFTELYCQTTGNNLNAGSTNTDAATLTYAGGTWVTTAGGVFTVASGNPSSDGVAVGDFASVYTTAGATIATYISRVTARDATTITLSATAISGAKTNPSTTGGATTCKIGGAWQGPNAAVSFPFGFITNAMVNTSSYKPRVNFKSGTNYAITAAMTHSLTNVVFQGYTTTVGDGGRATIDGGTSGASYILLSVTGERNVFEDLVFANNGATGNANGVVSTSVNTTEFCRCVFHDMRGAGAQLAGCVTNECEFYTNNKNGDAASGGLIVQSPVGAHIRSVFHDNTGYGVYVSTSTAAFINCIFDTNTTSGAGLNGNNVCGFFSGCDFYNNASCVDLSLNGANAVLANCNLIKSSGYALKIQTGYPVHLINCGVGSGTMANASGLYNTGIFAPVIEEGTVTYATDTAPWTDAANGDFRINLAAAKGAGRGSFMQTSASYTGAIGYPDIGAAQHVDSGGGSGYSRGRTV